eukprot:PLAT15944.1.p1 GENE.PLAT15944.1~~PLAT15944.1.p1  ORF type:complete len:312 (+),score=138.44 PLAT15944.1:93-1028(+)
MRIFQAEHVYGHSWETVSLALLNKYPNDKLSHVKKIDTLEQGIVPGTSKLRTVRLMLCASKLPGWVTKLGVRRLGYVCEQSEYDAKAKSIVLSTRNLTYSQYLQVEERCTYSPHPENPEWTLFRQEARITVTAPTFSRALEKVSVKNFRRNAARGLELLEELCQSVEAAEAERGLGRGVGSEEDVASHLFAADRDERKAAAAASAAALDELPVAHLMKPVTDEDELRWASLDGKSEDAMLRAPSAPSALPSAPAGAADGSASTSPLSSAKAAYTLAFGRAKSALEADWGRVDVGQMDSAAPSYIRQALFDF